MSRIELKTGQISMSGTLLHEKAPETCKWFLARLPFELRVVQAAWSGLAVFGDLGGAGRGMPFENITSYPAVGAILMYPGNAQGNAGEIYIPYGANKFACPIGQIAGNHFLSIDTEIETLREFGRMVRFSGARNLQFRRVPTKGSAR